MSLGLPNFNFIFQSKGVSAIERSARGIVAVILKDDTEGEEQNVYNKVDDVDFTQWTEDIVKSILCCKNQKQLT